MEFGKNLCSVMVLTGYLGEVRGLGKMWRPGLLGGALRTEAGSYAVAAPLHYPHSGPAEKRVMELEPEVTLHQRCLGRGDEVKADAFRVVSRYSESERFGGVGDVGD